MPVHSVQTLRKVRSHLSKVMFSNESVEWATPQSIFDQLDAEFYFTLDAAATKENAKCEKYFTRETNGLLRSWQNETVWLNPPYGREIALWVKKAYFEAQNGATVVLLIPARTDTAYWHDYVMQGEIRFIRGRLKFNNHEYDAPFPSAIVIFDGI